MLGDHVHAPAVVRSDSQCICIHACIPFQCDEPSFNDPLFSLFELFDEKVVVLCCTTLPRRARCGHRVAALQLGLLSASKCVLDKRDGHQDRVLRRAAARYAPHGSTKLRS